MNKLNRAFAPAFVFLLMVPVISSASFTDVTAENIYADALQYAQQNHIVSGYPDGSFKPENPINRAEFTKIIVNMFSAQEVESFDLRSSPGCFSDVPDSAWYAQFICFAKMKNLVSGYPDGTFRPSQNIAFSEAAKIISNGFGYQVPSDPVWYKPFVDQLAQLKAIPTTILHFYQQVTRGEMVEMVYRLKANITDKPSQDYDLLNGGAQTADTSNWASWSSPKVGKCPIFPEDNPWNTDVSSYPVDPNSDQYVASIGANGFLHPDFGGNGEYGIPITIVGKDQAKVPLLNVDYADESDPGPYPIPDNAKVENGSDAHVLVLDDDNCRLYELWAAEKVAGGWNAGSAAIFDLLSNALRPDGWTSADAAGLPVLPGLVRYNEVAAGAVDHALRFTVAHSQKGYIHPATHFASSSDDTSLPPMGLRLRLKASFDTSSFTGESKVILDTLKKYGMMVADNGSNWYITGEADPRWDDEDLNQLKTVPGSAFEVVQTGIIQH